MKYSILLFVFISSTNAFYMNEFRRVQDRNIGFGYSFSYQFAAFRRIEFAYESLPLEFPIFHYDFGLKKQFNPFLIIDISTGMFYGTIEKILPINNQYDLTVNSNTYGFFLSISTIGYAFRYKRVSFFFDMSTDLAKIQDRVKGNTNFTGNNVEILNINYSDLVLVITPSINFGFELIKNHEIVFSLFFAISDDYFNSHSNETNDYGIRTGPGISIKHWFWL